jgi:hypothetical protein
VNTVKKGTTPNTDATQPLELQTNDDATSASSNTVKEVISSSARTTVQASSRETMKDTFDQLSTQGDLFHFINWPNLFMSNYCGW